MPKQRLSLNEVVDDLVVVVAKILAHKGRVALGEEPAEEDYKYNKSAMNEILELAKPLIQSTQASRSITANTSAEVVNMLSEGKVTPAEGIALLKLIKEKVEAETKELEHQLRKELANGD